MTFHVRDGQKEARHPRGLPKVTPIPVAGQLALESLTCDYRMSITQKACLWMEKTNMQKLLLCMLIRAEYF